MATLLELFRSDFLLRDALLAGILVGIVCPWVGVYFVMRRIVFLASLVHVPATRQVRGLSWPVQGP